MNNCILTMVFPVILNLQKVMPLKMLFPSNVSTIYLDVKHTGIGYTLEKKQLSKSKII